MAALGQGFASKDDSAMVRQYFPDPIAKVEGSGDADAQKLVEGLMLGINLCAAAEAVAFARHLNVDLSQFFTLVNDAAGASTVFKTRGLEMIQGKIGNNAQTIDQAIEVLERVVQKARDLNCPLHLGNSALNMLLLAKRAGYGKEGSTSVIKVYGQ